MNKLSRDSGAGRALMCVAVSLALTIPFALWQQSNQFALIRPLDGMGPALGLLWGLPAVLGCATGSVAGSLIAGAGLADALIALISYAVYLAIPYLLWHGVTFLVARLHPRAAFDTAPRIDSSAKVALYLAAAVAGSAYMAAAFALTAPGIAAGELDGEMGFYHAFASLAYLGLPCVLVMGRRSASGNERRPAGRMALGELIVALFLAVTAALAVVFFLLTYGVYVLDGTFSTYEDMMMLVRTFYVILSQITPASLVVMMLAVRTVSRRATRPVEALTASTSAFVGDLDAHGKAGEGLRARPIDEHGMAPAAEVRELVDAVNAMERDLVAYVGELAVVTAERERVEAELDIARDIQASAIPHDFSAQAASGLSIDGFMRPAREVGGDFYDVFDIDGHRTALVVGDVSGKGVPAALFMMRALGLLRSCVMAEQDLGQALSAANDGLTERNDAMLFVTAFVCVLDRATGTLTYANAGHNPPSVVRGGIREYLSVRPGLVLGAMEGMSYASWSMPFAPGDQILLYTDGVTEAANEADQLLGEDRLARILATYDAEQSGLMSEAVVKSIDAFAGEAPQADDITLLNLVWDLAGGAIELPSEDDQLPSLLDFVEREVDAVGLDAETAHHLSFELKLVAEELFVNVCHYGHPREPAVPVHVDLRIDVCARRLYLTQWDGGVAFDPLAHDVVMPTADGPVGGLGVHLVRRIMDEVVYERVGERNALYMVKSF